jgi:N-acetylglucosaminyldiphosphoundecaprenol N-acetyl-beta-D-mannosaminyltransferase
VLIAAGRWMASKPMPELSCRPETIAEAYLVLGVRVHAVQIPAVISAMEEWIAGRKRAHFIAVTGMHGVVEARHDPRFRAVLNCADLVVPDGMPLVWLARIKGHALKRRVYGPELMGTFCEQTSAKGYRHFFYGGAPGVADDLAERFAARFPGVTPVGTYCPPFRPLTGEEDIEVVSRINSSNADIVWVGLSTPKQERWMFDHRDRLEAPVLVGVGAAFDFHTGRITQAPEWMRENGLEWLFRLLHEPRRLWKRYLVFGTEFTFCVLLELAGFKKFD